MMGVLLDDLAVAFAMRCDEQNLSLEAGIRAAEELADELMYVAEDRASYAEKDGNDG